jgi:hypothetical protein
MAGVLQDILGFRNPCRHTLVRTCIHVGQSHFLIQQLNTYHDRCTLDCKFQMGHKKEHMMEKNHLNPHRGEFHSWPWRDGQQ